MKKILGLIAIVSIAFLGNANAQRFGTTSHSDNTGRVLTYVWSHPTSTATSLKVTPNAYHTIVRDTLNSNQSDSVITTSAKDCDLLTYIFVNRATADTVTLSTGYHYVTSTIPIPASKKATISFIYDKTVGKFIELSRSIITN